MFVIRSVRSVVKENTYECSSQTHQDRSYTQTFHRLAKLQQRKVLAQKVNIANTSRLQTAKVQESQPCRPDDSVQVSVGTPHFMAREGGGVGEGILILG
jgi:hypothetical protein